MDYTGFLERIINEGIEAARADYIRPDQKNLLEGSLQGFEDCRGKTPEELSILYSTALKKSNEQYLQQNGEGYWYSTGRALEIEWVCNCVSAILINEGLSPILGHLPTCRGVTKAAEVIGVSQ